MSRFLIPIFAVILFLSCKKNPSLSMEDSFPGYYKATKITSPTAVDLNNDGLKTANIYLEMSDPYTSPNGQQMSFYDFNSISNFVEVRPLPYQTNPAKLIAFNFPHQIIDSLGNNVHFLAMYINELISYTYEFNPNNSITVSSTNLEYASRIGEIDSLILKEGGVMMVLLKKYIFDFADKTWKRIDITAEYSKI